MTMSVMRTVNVIAILVIITGGTWHVQRRRTFGIFLIDRHTPYRFIIKQRQIVVLANSFGRETFQS